MEWGDFNNLPEGRLDLHSSDYSPVQIGNSDVLEPDIVVFPFQLVSKELF